MFNKLIKSLMKTKILKKNSLIKSSEVMSQEEMEMILAGSGSCAGQCFSGACKVLACTRLNGAGDCGCR